MIVLIDNGHGENTPGKCSPDKRLREYKKAREIARRLVNTPAEQRSGGTPARTRRYRCRLPSDASEPTSTATSTERRTCSSCLYTTMQQERTASGRAQEAGAYMASPGQTSADLFATDPWNAAEECPKTTSAALTHTRPRVTTTASRNLCVPTGATKTPTMRHVSHTAAYQVRSRADGEPIPRQQGRCGISDE